MSPYKIIFEKLKNIDKPIAHIYRHLISIFLEDEFNNNFFNLINYHMENGNDDFNQIFYSYHKQFRQIDMYPLKAARWIGKKEYEKNIDKWENIIDNNSYVNNYYLFSSIGSNLDMIFWNIIYVDSEGIFDKIFEEIYNDYIYFVLNKE